MAAGIGPATWSMGAIVAQKYQLEREIGKGGFGSVFRAKRIADGAPVAIKMLLRAAMLRGDAIARFRREAELSMRLRNESTIRVLDWGDSGNGIPYIAFELLDGTSLEELLRSGPLPEERAVTVTLALLGSLEEAHRLGIVHRDVKPSNIFLCARPAGLVKLLDFGVAKSTVSDQVALTAQGVMVGTPAYMAPEQIGTKDVTAATDLYAVALVLAEMLTGRPVYDDTPMRVCMDKMRGVPVPFAPSLRQSAYIELLERATRILPTARFASAREMKVALAGAAPRVRNSQLEVSPTSAPATARQVGGGTEMLPTPVVANARVPSIPDVVINPALAATELDQYGPTAAIRTPHRGIPSPAAQSVQQPAPASAPAPISGPAPSSGTVRFAAHLARTADDSPPRTARIPQSLSSTVDDQSKSLPIPVPKKNGSKKTLWIVIAAIVLIGSGIGTTIALLLMRR